MKELKLAKKYVELVEDILLDEEFNSLKNYIQHGDTTIYDHVINVSFVCFKKYYGNKKIDIRSLIVGALLHDYFLYDWHVSRKINKRKGLHGYTHPQVAMENATKRFNLTKKEQRMIRSHMWPLTLFHIPTSKEAWILCLVDKKVSWLETFKNDKEKSKELQKVIARLLNENKNGGKYE